MSSNASSNDASSNDASESAAADRRPGPEACIDTQRAARPEPSLGALAERIRAQMPATRALQFSLLPGEAESLVATAPLGPNANHRGTAFGGSLSMLATVAGWAMAHRLLRERGHKAEVVIQRSRADYRAPVREHLCLRCKRPPREERASFFEALRRWGRARLSLSCTAAAATEGGEPAFRFEGAYAALAPSSREKRAR